MHRNFEAMNIGKEPPDDNGKAPRPMKTYAAGALAAAAVLALFSLVAGSESIASLGGDAQEKWNDVPCPAGMEGPRSTRILVFWLLVARDLLGCRSWPRSGRATRRRSPPS